MRRALQTALLFARFIQPTLGGDDMLVQLRMALLRIGQLHIQLFKAAFSGDAALLQIFQLCVDFSQISADLITAGLRLLRNLRHAQGFHLQTMRA